MDEKKLKNLFQTSKKEFVDNYEGSDGLWDKITHVERKNKRIYWPVFASATVAAVLLVTFMTWKFFPVEVDKTEFQLADYSNAYEEFIIDEESFEVSFHADMELLAMNDNFDKAGQDYEQQNDYSSGENGSDYDSPESETEALENMYETYQIL